MAGALEQFVNSVRTLSAQGNFGQLCETIGKSLDFLSKHASNLDNVLETFDIQQHSLGVLAILCVKHSLSNNVDMEILNAQTKQFFETCNGEQVRYATDRYAELCHKYVASMIEKKTPQQGINTVARAISKIQISTSQLTSIHADLCQLCLLAKNMKPALPFLDVEITEISKESGQFDAKHFLMYYYYGGMVYTSIKQYDRALYFFEIAITTPSLAVSHIMMEAYKKFILVGLIRYGKIPSLPKYTSHVVAKYIKPLCQAYHDLTTAYTTKGPEDVRAVLTKHNETFTSDNNVGLVKQCVTSLYKKNIQRLTKTFLTLSLADVAQRVQLSSPRDAEKYILHMIEDGEIYANINQKDGMVIFKDNPEKYNNVTMLA